MPIDPSDILTKLSVKTGSAGDSTAQGDSDQSLGKYVSTTEIVSATLHNLFDLITGDENAASATDYRCFFVHNNHGSITWEDVKVWVQSQDAGGADASIGLDPAGATPKGQASAQAAEIATETDAPAGVSFSTPASKAAGLSVGDVAPGEVFAVWVKRDAQNSGAVNNDGIVVSYEGDTAA